MFDGNQADVTTHIPNWDRLRELLGREDFIYIGDSKVCSTANMNHIVGNGGKFITILPKNRKEVVQFRDRLEQGEEIEWQEGYRKEDSRKKGCWVTYRFYEGEKSQEGYRIIWVHSSSKEIQDRKTRDRRISKTEEGLKELSGKLNRYKLKTKEQIEQVVASICKGSGDLVMPEIIEEKTVAKVKIGRGRPGPNTDYENREQISYRLQWCRNEEAIKKDARTDGIFPHITNTELAATEVLRTYKKQPFLEKRFQTQKTVLEVAPVFLEKPSRIEAMMFLYFIGLMIVSLMERNIRKEMATQKITKIPISASGLKTKSPTWNNICRFFRNVHLSLITQGQMIIRSSVKGLTALHYQMLKLLKVSRTAYDLTDGWWQFMPG
ncbi:MAG: IS1634 family transposase [Desulfobacterales bacterium]|nr:IS1634 family transposase [Desulfobacterales bacterium]